jgi:glycerophosphoryl diester phosphodiesterase
MVMNRRTRPHFLSYDLDGLPNRWVTTARRRGLPVVTWTVRTPEHLARARDLADNLIFEGLSPDLVRR